MNLPQWLAYLESLHPNEIELGLDRIRLVADKLPLDFSQQKIVCVGGTNGKGSTVALLSSILQAKGKHVGCYSSPHLLHYNERVCINGATVSDVQLCQAFELVEQARESTQLTYFEFGTLAALVIFAQQKLDYLLLEVGLGGRLDAVNILNPDLSIVTNIALDHTDWLGETREAIGHEKAGIYRANCPAIFGELDMPDSVLSFIDSIGANLYHRGKQYSWNFESVVEGIKASWQWCGLDIADQTVELKGLPLEFTLNNAIDNVASVIQAAHLLEETITQTDIEAGLKTASLTGRFQQIKRETGHTIVLDVAHNPHAAENLFNNLQTHFPEQNIRIVIAMLDDKDSSKVLATLKSLIKHWYAAEIKEDRGSPVKILYNQLLEIGVSEVSCFDEISEAFIAAEQDANSDDVILVTGSFYTVSTVLELI